MVSLGVLRPGVPADLEILYQIDQACYPPGIAYSRRTLRAFLTMPGAHCLVAEVAAGIAGFIVTVAENDWAHIITLDVLEPHRRRGIGSALLKEAEQQLAARGVRRVTLETAHDNAPAIAFWQKHGYRTRAVRKRYYLGRIDAWSMEKPLPQPEP
jgi:ribosomal protein S18 acetylase RimI-like enzyme